jgi:hypothetical protein
MSSGNPSHSPAAMRFAFVAAWSSMRRSASWLRTHPLRPHVHALVADPWFRYVHLGAIAFVAAEALLGVMCPLTLWEDMLRGGMRPESFVGRWVYWLLYYRAPEWVFTVAYVGWAAATLFTLWWAPRKSIRAAPS